MSQTHAATRLTCFALVSCIETDLREFLASNELLSRQFLPPDARAKAAARRSLDTEVRSDGPVTDDRDLLHYIDFGDLAKSLRMGRLGIADPEGARTVAERLEQRVATRNRVCHSRPLETEDLPELLDLAKDVLKLWPEVGWTGTRDTLQRLESDPTHVLYLQIPRYWRLENSRLAENLPLPEFDDTGFLGRQADRKELTKVLLAEHPIVTVVGEGGVGKTALAVRCLYDLVDLRECPFDAIAWVSLKTRVLTAAGAKELRESIREVLGVVREAAGQMAVPHAEDGSVAECLDEILGFMRTFRVLLAIDNLETIDWAGLRPLLEEIPRGSKVLITSRVGLGELERRYPLSALELPAAVALARKFASALRCDVIIRQPAQALERACALLYQNPLLIRWYVSSVHGGLDPAQLLGRDAIPFLEALKFCFQNLFERLTGPERAIVYALASAARPVTGVELCYLVPDMERHDLHWALGTLHHSSMLRRTAAGAPGADASFSYSLTAIAADYVSRLSPPPQATVAMVRRQLRELQRVTANSARRHSRFDPLHLTAGSRDEQIVAAVLVRALRASSAARHEDALKLVEEAKSLLGTYGEVYRVAGAVHAARGDVLSASQEYAQACALSPASETIRYHYWQFLHTTADDDDAALRQVEAALAIAPGSPELLAARAQSLVRLERCQEASEVFEHLLTTIAGREPRARVALRDQAAECYRRWAHQTSSDGRGVAIARFSRAMAIIQASVEAKEADPDLWGRAAQVLQDWAEIAFDGGAPDLAIELDAAVGRLEAHAAAGELQRPRWQQFLGRYGPRLPSAARLLKQTPLDRPAPFTIAAEPGVDDHGAPDAEHHGSVDRLKQSGGFGFIRWSGGPDLHFSRTALFDGLTWEQLQPGLRVRFQLGSNAKGRCAIRVRSAG